MNIKSNVPLILIVIQSLAVTFIYAQDPYFRQTYSTALYNNPALCGSARQMRIQALQNISWRSYYTSYLAFEWIHKKLPVDIGLTNFYDRAGNGMLEEFTHGLNISKGFRAEKKVSFRAGIAFNYHHKKLRTEDLVFGDQLDSRYGYIYKSKTVLPPILNRRYFTASAGIVIHHEKFLTGYSISNIFRPNTNLLSDGTYRLPLRHTVLSAVRILVVNNYSLNLTGLAVFQGSFNQIMPGINFCMKYFKLGVQYRKSKAWVFSGGFVNKSISVSYSFDFFKSWLTGHIFDTHELSFSWRFGKAVVKGRPISWMNNLF
jgi:type IX secretion system PorP/SprF family membrane protein